MKARLSQILPNLLATRVEYPFGGTTIKCAAFLIERSPGLGGNVWVYASSHVGDYLEHIAELGGVTRQLLNHRDEASKFCNVLKDPVFCHADEKAAIQEKGCVVSQTYGGPVVQFNVDLAAYHTPGHARGVTSYLWRNQKEGFSVLFTGDSLYCNEHGKFAHGPLQYHSYPGNKEDMIKSFELYLELNPTYVCSGLTGSEFLNKFDRDQVFELIEQLKCE